MAQVTDPDETDPKRLLNSTLLKIKEERKRSSSLSDYDEDEIEDLSQAPRPQQFYQDLDTTLNGLQRDIYIATLQKSCGNDYGKINDYRERLSDRAKGFPECPEARLVNRRNSSHTTREKKCATDCYILQAFVNGVRSREILEVFSSAQSGGNETINLTDETDGQYDLTNELLKPDVLAILSQMQAEMTEIAKKQRLDSHILHDLHSDMTTMTTSFRTLHGTVNSILARTSTQTAAAQITRLQTDVTKLGSTIAVMNKRFLDNTLNAEMSASQKNTNHTETNKPRDKSYSEIVEIVDLTKQNSDDVSNTVSVEVDVNTTEASTNNGATSQTHKDNGLINSKRSDINLPKQTHTHPPKQTQNTARTNARQDNPRSEHRATESSSDRFISARRRKITSYYVSNIDTTTDEGSIRDYLKEQGVTPTHMTMYYGKTGSSARVNVYYEDEEKVESDYFWPDGVSCRKWVSRSVWLEECEARRRNRYDSNRQSKRSHDNYSYDNSNYDKYDYDRDRGSNRTFDDQNNYESGFNWQRNKEDGSWE